MNITQELVKELYDYKEDGFLYWKSNRGVNKTKGILAGSMRKDIGGDRYIIRVNNKGCFGARIIFLWHHGYLPEMVDHIDRDSTNNKIENLRAATRSQNQKNRTSAKNSTSKHLGVHQHCEKWQSAININGKKVHLGSFKTEEEAAIAYNNAAVKYHGDFANINII